MRSDKAWSTGEGNGNLKLLNCGVEEKSPLRVPWTARRSNQSVLKESNPEYSLERLLLKLQYFSQLTH